MAIIPQWSFFSWKALEPPGDLERLWLVLNFLPIEALMRVLEHERGKGRDDYPIRAVANSLLAGIVFQHPTIESLRRELAPNGPLREFCGFQPGAVPPPSVYPRFWQHLLDHESVLNQRFDDLVEALRTALPHFAERLAIDGKALPSFAQNPNKNETPDGRRDLDTDHGVKHYHGKNKDGKPWEKIVHWVGYKIHLLVDSTYELPLAFTVTKASVADITEAPVLLAQLAKRHPLAMKAARVLAGDKGYDSRPLVTELWDAYRIKPVIDIRNRWKDGESSPVLPGYANVTYDYQGVVECGDPATGIQRTMANGGFEQDRSTLKKVCSVDVAGGVCEGTEECPVKHQLRIQWDHDRRMFTPIDRASYRWKQEYQAHTAVERVNSRLDVSFGFEWHTIRANQADQLRSLVRPAI